MIIDILSNSMDSLLESLLLVWKEHKITIVSVKDILMYMDRLSSSSSSSLSHHCYYQHHHYHV